MRNLLVLFAGLAICGSAMAADDGVNWKFNGEIRGRYKSTQNESGIEKDAKLASNTNNMQQRTQLGFTAIKGEQFTASVKINNNSTWGRELSSGDTADEISQGNSDNLMTFADAWVWWKTNDMMSFRWGRGGFTIADGAVVSANDWEAVPTVFDGVLGSFDFGFMHLNVFGVKGAELGTGETPPSYQLAYDRESNFYGMSADFKNLPDMIKMANIHILKEQQDPVNSAAAATAVTGKDYIRYGVTVGGDYMGADYKLTYAGVTGKDRAYKNGTTEAKNYDFTVDANMIDFAAGYTMAEMMNTRLGLVYHQDSGDSDGIASADYAVANDHANNGDKKNGTYDPFHYEKHDYSGLMDIVGWGNLTDIGVVAKTTPMENTTFGRQYHMFTRSNDKTAKAVSGITHTAGAGNTEKAIGNELDFTASHKYTESFDMMFRFSTFSPGAYLTKNRTAAGVETEVKRDPITQAFLQAKFKF